MSQGRRQWRLLLLCRLHGYTFSAQRKLKYCHFTNNPSKQYCITHPHAFINDKSALLDTLLTQYFSNTCTMENHRPNPRDYDIPAAWIANSPDIAIHPHVKSLAAKDRVVTYNLGVLKCQNSELLDRMTSWVLPFDAVLLITNPFLFNQALSVD